MKKAIRDKAREMRAAGRSVRDIAKELKVSVGSVSPWVRDIVLTDAQVEALRENQKRYRGQNKGSQVNRQKHLVLRKVYQEEGRTKAREMRPLHLAGCMLYWAEGGKIRNRIYFANSDPNMHVLFMRFLREEMGIHDSEIVMYIHCHTADEGQKRELEDFWLGLLHLTRANHRKTFTKKGSEIQRSILQYGVCGIGVNKVSIAQHIYGAIQEYGGFEKPEWLL
jgi:hypothetical protein